MQRRSSYRSALPRPESRGLLPGRDRLAARVAFDVARAAAGGARIACPDPVVLEHLTAACVRGDMCLARSSAAWICLAYSELIGP